MLHRLRFSPERNPQAHKLHQESFCGSCQAQAGFSGRMTSLTINYLLAYLQMIAVGLEGSSTQQASCRSRPWIGVEVRRASPGVERLLSAVNLALLSSWLHLQHSNGDRRARIGLVLLRSSIAKAEEELRGLGLEPARFQSLAQTEPFSDAMPDVFSQVLVRIAALCGRPELTEAMARAGQSLARCLVLWHLSLPPSPHNPDWLGHWRPELAKDPEGLRQRLAAHVAELRGHLEALPLGEAREAALAVVETMEKGEYVEQRPGTTWAEAVKRGWMQSGDTC
jgi:hypothetical protein